MNDPISKLAKTHQGELCFRIKKAKGSYIYDYKNNAYLDFVSGVSVCNIGHNNHKVKKAIKQQLKKYNYVMVYGETIQDIQVDFANKLSSFLPKNLQITYFVNSGSEAIEGAIKLCIKHTNRHEIISTKESYHGSTIGALSISGNSKIRTAFSPVLPNVKFIRYNNINDLDKISKNTAGVIIEVIQSASGFVCSDIEYIHKLNKKCKETKTLLIFDEIQTGFGRTGKLFAFEDYGVSPNILVTGKALGGGMPIGAFSSSQEIMQNLSKNPPLGHITTFGGHPLCMAAGLANLEVLNSGIIDKVKEKERIFRDILSNSNYIKKINGKGLMLAILFENENICSRVKDICFKNKLLTFQNLYNSKSLRITPALNISNKDIIKGSKIILNAIKTSV